MSCRLTIPSLSLSLILSSVQLNTTALIQLYSYLIHYVILIKRFFCFFVLFNPSIEWWSFINRNDSFYDSSILSSNSSAQYTLLIMFARTHEETVSSGRPRNCFWFVNVFVNDAVSYQKKKWNKNKRTWMPLIPYLRPHIRNYTLCLSSIAARREVQFSKI